MYRRSGDEQYIVHGGVGRQKPRVARLGSHKYPRRSNRNFRADLMDPSFAIWIHTDRLRELFLRDRCLPVNNEARLKRRLNRIAWDLDGPERLSIRDFPETRTHCWRAIDVTESSTGEKRREKGWKIRKREGRKNQRLEKSDLGAILRFARVTSQD